MKTQSYGETVRLLDMAHKKAGMRAERMYGDSSRFGQPCEAELEIMLQAFVEDDDKDFSFWGDWMEGAFDTLGGH